jgi:hypothetical protein
MSRKSSIALSDLENIIKLEKEYFQNDSSLSVRQTPRIQKLQKTLKINI